ncbi:TPA: YvcK family protein [Candidatus Gastranaerophilales bacterium HUM_15]|nr:glr4164 protein [Acinetobacter sp. CAG:196]DAA95527.1 MAG TPA: YvcK family protein [Candidatus Gastranaerophilales bacterium HUM_8]DAB03597.1 MAG TPA: YvcK family protein [Candidatus Gastranaerophilales bacterium HUM_11]DAB09206.1 MAG TPA: YvcK family protein [Candidatus Gastranaerophilales bacterium HUM_15]DAB14153.1 MAG TPA: YvcK family protein [Candidatus Gastranaerophilales bacterium HUM_17]DAB18344.1 MAG TPA: YvcK family protein [Candidatus Gastranaerophilales bacterium HUM_19]DAB2525
MFSRFKNNVKVTKDVGWLLPGLEVKRWFLLIFFGSIMIVLGFMVLANVRPIYLTLELIRKAALILPSNFLAAVFILIGSAIFFKGWQKTTLSIMDMDNKKGNISVLEKLYRRRKLNKGAKIVAIGGGTGLSMLLRGIKKYTNNVTAIVTVGDDGGSSGRLREEMGVLPPGDIRNCIAALADDEDMITELFQYRFKNGEGLEGHSFGNLFLTALCSITGDMVRAVKESSNVLNIRGVVLPATLDDMKLAASFEDGRIIHGESNIPEAHGKIKRLFTEPEHCHALPEAITAIHEADLIILGPGSLYTSVIPNLLVDGIVEAIDKSHAKKIYVCNIMTQPGETDNYSVASHVNALITHANGKKIVDAVLVNDSLPDNISEGYAKSGSIPVRLDMENIAPIGIEVVSQKLLQENKEGLVRHSSHRVARAVYYWYRRAVKR